MDLAEGPHISDVGYGNLTPTAPLAPRPGEEQATPTSLSADTHGSELVLQARLGDVWDSLYRFGPKPGPPIDYEMANWFASAFPGSPFCANLIVARPSPSCRTTLLNRRSAMCERDGNSARRVLAGIGNYREALVEHFASCSRTTSSRASPPRWRRARRTRRSSVPSSDGKRREAALAPSLALARRSMLSRG